MTTRQPTAELLRRLRLPSTLFLLSARCSLFASSVGDSRRFRKHAAVSRPPPTRRFSRFGDKIRIRAANERSRGRNNRHDRIRRDRVRVACAYLTPVALFVPARVRSQGNLYFVRSSSSLKIDRPKRSLLNTICIRFESGDRPGRGGRGSIRGQRESKLGTSADRTARDRFGIPFTSVSIVFVASRNATRVLSSEGNRVVDRPIFLSDNRDRIGI